MHVCIARALVHCEGSRVSMMNSAACAGWHWFAVSNTQDTDRQSYCHGGATGCRLARIVLVTVVPRRRVVVGPSQSSYSQSCYRCRSAITAVTASLSPRISETSLKLCICTAECNLSAGVDIRVVLDARLRERGLPPGDVVSHSY